MTELGTWGTAPAATTAIGRNKSRPAELASAGFTTRLTGTGMDGELADLSVGLDKTIAAETSARGRS